MFTRLLTLNTSAQNSIFLFGPRGTGKTAWVKAYFKGAIYLDLLDSGLFTQLSANPQHLERFIPESYSGWIIIDEIQKITLLLNEVHRLIESKRYRFVLTGSSARQLRKKGVNLLAGRAHTYYMHSLTAREVGSQFCLKTALRFGMLPGLFSTQEPEIFLKSYVHTYVKEEVVQEGLTRNVGDFHRFLQVASFSQGSLVNMNNIARETNVSRKVVENYFSIVEDLLLGFFLQPFRRRAVRNMVAHPKFYFADVGVFQQLRPRGPLDVLPEINGIAFESFLIQEIRALNDYLAWGFQLYFWRTHQQEEVDLVLYGEKGLLAFEIKYSDKVSKSDLKGLQAFKREYPEASCYVIYLGAQSEYFDTIEVVPYEKFEQLFVRLLG